MILKRIIFAMITFTMIPYNNSISFVKIMSKKIIINEIIDYPIIINITIIITITKNSIDTKRYHECKFCCKHKYYKWKCCK